MSEYKCYPKYKSSGIEWIGDVPDTWDMYRIKQFVTSCVNGIWGDEPQDDDDDIICVRVADFDMNILGISSDDLTIRNIAASHQKGRIISGGNILIEKSGGGEKQPVGRAISCNLNNRAVCSNFIGKLEVANIVARYLVYYFSSLHSAGLNQKAIKQTTGIQNLDLKYYLNEKIAIPSTNDQESIASYLDRKTAHINKLIQKKEVMSGLLKEKRSAIINQAVTKGLDSNAKMKPSGIEWIGNIPEKWQVRPAFDLVCEQQVKNKGNVEGNVLSLSYGNIIGRDVENNFGLLPESFETYQIVYSGNIILRLTDLQNDKKSLRVGLVKEQGIITSAYVCLKIKKDMYSAYLYQLLHTYDLAKVYYGLGGGVRQSMKFSDLKWIPILVPTIGEQKKIIEFLDKKIPEIDRLLRQLDEAIRKLYEYRSSVINAAVTGKIDVREVKA